MKVQYINLIAFCVGLIAAFLSGRHSIKCNRLQNVTNSDTIVIWKSQIDTIQKERIKIKTIYEKQIDTIYMFDSVAIDSAYTKAIQKLIQIEGAGFFN